MINTAGVYTAAPTLEPVSAVTHAAPVAQGTTAM